MEITTLGTTLGDPTRIRYQTPEGNSKVREYSAALPYPFKITHDGFELNIP